MKKLSLLLIFALVISITNAQTSQGNILIAGVASLGFGTQKFESGGSPFEDKYFEISAMPTVGFFVADGIMVGGMVEFGFAKFTQADASDNYNTSSIWMVGPTGRYYHSSDYFGEVYVAFGGENNESVFGGTPSFTNKESIFGFSIGVGRAIFLNEFVAIEPMVKYRSEKHTNSDDSTIFRTVAGPQIAVALTIFIGE